MSFFQQIMNDKLIIINRLITALKIFVAMWNEIMENI